MKEAVRVSTEIPLELATRIKESMVTPSWDTRESLLSVKKVEFQAVTGFSRTIRGSKGEKSYLEQETGGETSGSICSQY